MKINTIEYLRRLNKGNYEHEELKASATIDEDESAGICFLELKEFVERALGLIKSVEGTQLPLPVVEEKVEVKKPVKKVKKEEQKEEVVEQKIEEKEEVKEVKKETKRVKQLNKSTAYDRTLQTHKTLLGEFLDTKYPKWKTAENLKKAQLGSTDLDGTDFLNENGDMLESFKEAFSSFMDA